MLAPLLVLVGGGERGLGAVSQEVRLGGVPFSIRHQGDQTLLGRIPMGDELAFLREHQGVSFFTHANGINQSPQFLQRDPGDKECHLLVPRKDA